MLLKKFWSEHRNFTFSVLVALIIVGVGFYVTQEKRDALVLGAASDAPVVATTTAAQFSDRDSDGDYLPDWEEVVYGSDPGIFDTDGDGDGDGDEVRIGRNPIVAGPNDVFAVLDAPSFATSSDDVLGMKKEFFATYLKEQSQEIQGSTFRGLLNKFDPKEFNPRLNLVDLSISSDNSPAALRAYANSFGTIITKYTSHPFPRPEWEVIEEGLKNRDDKVLNDGLQLPAVTYRNFARDLKALEVPSELATLHLGIVNGYDVMGRALFAMIFFLKDPLRGTGAYEAYLGHTLFVTDGYAGVVHYLYKSGIEFTAEESGYYFRWKPEYEANMNTTVSSTSPSTTIQNN